MIVHSEQPYNAEPALADLQQTYYTAQNHFYVRSHGTIPHIDAERYRLTVGGLVTAARSFSLEDLRRSFPARSFDAVLQCAGNRRADLHAVEPVSGDPWNAAAIGNARWTGVPLVDVLDAVGCEARAGLHVELTSEDDVEIEGERFKYAVSIPVEKAMSPDVLLAWAMNGEPLAREHGFPIRAVVAGFAGVRSAKWLTGINVLQAPSNGYMQARDYKLFPPTSRKGSEDWSRALTINALPLNCAICEPPARALVPTGELRVRGWALATGASRIARVDVSGDGGKSWVQASLDDRSESPWSWTQWSALVRVDEGAAELVARAWDEAGQSQPSESKDLWNFKGYLSSAWDRVLVLVD